MSVLFQNFPKAVSSHHNLMSMWISFIQVQVAQIMGKPTPKAPANTGTPPLILRMPVIADEKQQAGDESVVKNFTAQISVVTMQLIV